MSIIGAVLGSVASSAVGGLLGGKKKSANSQPFQTVGGSGLGDLKMGIMNLPERKDSSKPAEVEDPKVFMEYADLIRSIKASKEQ